MDLQWTTFIILAAGLVENYCIPINQTYITRNLLQQCRNTPITNVSNTVDLSASDLKPHNQENCTADSLQRPKTVQDSEKLNLKSLKQHYGKRRRRGGRKKRSIFSSARRRSSNRARRRRRERSRRRERNAKNKDEDEEDNEREETSSFMAAKYGFVAAYVVVKHF